MTPRIRLLHLLLFILHLMTALALLYLPLALHALRLSDLIAREQFGNDDIPLLFGLLVVTMVLALFVARKPMGLALTRLRVVFNGLLESAISRRKQRPDELRADYARQANRDALWATPMLVACLLMMMRLPLIKPVEGWITAAWVSLVILWMVLQVTLMLAVYATRDTPLAAQRPQGLLGHSRRLLLVCGILAALTWILCMLLDSVRTVLYFPDSPWAVIWLITTSLLLSILHTQLASARYESNRGTD